jgi:hypothetical protein
MSDRPDGHSPTEFDPGSMPASSFGLSRAPWYKRPWVVLTLALIVIVGVSVVVDLPHHISPAQDAGDQNAAIRQINGDLKTCSFSIEEAYHLYRLDAGHHVTAAQAAQIPQLLTGDYAFCSGTTSPLLDMTNELQIVDTTAGKQIEHLRSTVFTWINYDARNAITDIQYLVAHPGDSTHLRRVAQMEDLLAQDRLAALGYLARADRILGVTLVNLKLPTLARLPGT